MLNNKMSLDISQIIKRIVTVTKLNKMRQLSIKLYKAVYEKNEEEKENKRNGKGLEFYG